MHTSGWCNAGVTTPEADRSTTGGSTWAKRRRASTEPASPLIRATRVPAGELAHLGAVSVDCCDRQARQPGVRGVVVTDDRQVSRHRKTELIRRVQDSDRGEVVRREDRGRAVR